MSEGNKGFQIGIVGEYLGYSRLDIRKYVMKRIIIVLFGILVVAFSSLYAQEMSQPAKGDGTNENPYLISSAEELRWFANEVNENKRYSICATLTQDIDLNPGFTFDENGYHGVGTPDEWIPIGFSETSDEYIGEFDGSGFSIKGIYSTKGHALFSFVGKNGRLKNVGIINSLIMADNNSASGFCESNVGIVDNCYNKAIVISRKGTAVGFCFTNKGSILNSYNSGKIIGRSTSRGICSSNQDGGTISHCYNLGTISGGYEVSGICGYNGFNGGTIRYCYNAGAVSGVNTNGIPMVISGVCGENRDNLINCYNKGSITGTGERSKVGGVCVYNLSGANLSKCYNTGNISGMLGIGNVCGVGGICVDSEAPIVNCYNTGELVGTNFVGGICGTSWSSIENCYNRGFVNGDNAAGICWYNKNSISNCYNLGNVSAEFSAGICGVSEVLIDNCYNIGFVSGSHTSGINNNNTFNGIVRNCFFLRGSVEKGISDELDLEKTALDIIQEMQDSRSFVVTNGWKTPSSYVNGQMNLPELGLGNENTSIKPIIYYVVNINTIEGGTVTSNGGTYKDGEVITVTATPNNGYRFVSWTNSLGQILSTNESYTFTVTSDLLLTANFEKEIVEQYYAITVKANMGGTVNTSGGTYKEGEVVTLIATPNNGYRFVNWTTDDGSIISTQSYYTYVMTAATAKNLIANFEKIEPNHYSVDIWATTGGRVSNNGGTYVEGTQITVQAFPDDGFHFMHWTDANGRVLSHESVYTFTVTSNTILRANFEEELYFIHIIESPDIALRPNNFFVKWNETAVIHAELIGEGSYTDEIRFLFKRGENGSWETQYGSGFGDFYIDNVQSDIYVKAERYAPVANETIKSEDVSVCTRNGNLYVQTSNLQQVNIITLNGTIMRSQKQSGLQCYEGLKPGVYLVRVGGKVLKVLITQ